MAYLPTILSEFQKELNRLNQPLWSSYKQGTDLMLDTDWQISVDIKETPDQYVINADIPGVKAKDIDIQMENGVITIKGHREAEHKESDAGYRRIERSSGSFIRSFALPDAVDAEKISATNDKGVLTVTLPKSAKHKTHKIEVKE